MFHSSHQAAYDAINQTQSLSATKTSSHFLTKDNDKTRQVLIQKADVIKSTDTVISDTCPAHTPYTLCLTYNHYRYLYFVLNHCFLNNCIINYKIYVKYDNAVKYKSICNPTIKYGAWKIIIIIHYCSKKGFWGRNHTFIFSMDINFFIKWIKCDSKACKRCYKWFFCTFDISIH